MKYTHIFTSESVGEGHPDKVADLISDSILDACLAQDPASRVACETLVKDNHVVLAGEITTKAVIDYEKIVRDTIAEIGYRTAADPNTSAMLFATLGFSAITNCILIFPPLQFLILLSHDVSP